MDADVIVVGGGPAGSTVARLLGDAGWTVRILDRARFPRPKPCGECVNPGGVAALARLGMLDSVLALGPSRIHGWEIRAGERVRAEADFGEGVEPGLAVDRARLDATLLTAARESGVDVEEGVRARTVWGGSAASLPSIRVREPDGSVAVRRARVVVGADGLRSVTARALGAPTRSARLRKVSITAHVRAPGLDRRRGLLDVRGDGTLGLAPIGRGCWNVTIVVDPARFGRRLASSPPRFLTEWIDERVSEWDGSWALAEGPWASGPFDRPVRSPVGHGVVLLGDAAGYFDPLTGQGIYRALRSAELAAPFIHRALLRTPRYAAPATPLLTGYARALRSELRAGRWVQRSVEWVLSRPATRRAAIAWLGRHPAALGALIRSTGDVRTLGALPSRTSRSPIAPTRE